MKREGLGNVKKQIVKGTSYRGTKLPDINLRSSDAHSAMKISEITGGPTRLRVNRVRRPAAVKEELQNKAKVRQSLRLEKAR